MEGDFSSDPIRPSIQISWSRLQPPAPKGAKVTVYQLFEWWRAYNADKKAASTTRRYLPSFQSLVAFLEGRDVRLVEQGDLWPGPNTFAMLKADCRRCRAKSRT